MKPAGAGARTHAQVARLNKLNSHLLLFPPVAESADPTQLPVDEWLDLLKFGVPNSWQTAIILQNFDLLQHAVAKFVVFRECF